MRAHLVILLAMLSCIAIGCPSAEPEPEADVYELPDTTTGWYDDGPVIEPDPSDFAREGESCADGVFQCAWGLGCVNETCGRCVESNQCRDTQACVQGVCTECASSDDCREGRACVESFCLPERLPRWELTIAPDQLSRMSEDPYAEVWADAVLNADGVTYDRNVRVRLMGGSTRALPKKSFRIEFPEDAEHPGFQRKINLKAEYNDPSTRRHAVALETFRRFTPIPTPRSRFIDFFLNGEDMGVMHEVERIGGKFLERHGRERDLLFELKYSHDYGGFVPLPDAEQYAETYSKVGGDDEDLTPLVGLIEDVLWADFLESEPGTASPTRTRESVDQVSYTRLLAVMAMLQSQEHVTQNVYLSLQDRGAGARWEFYPWDLDLTLGCVWNIEESNPLCGDLVHDRWWMEGFIYEGLQVGEPNVCWCNMAIHMTLGAPRRGPEHQALICEMAQSDWWSARGPRYVDALAVHLSEHVADDPGDRNEDLDAFLAAGREIQDFMALRAAYLAVELGCF